MQKGGGNMVDSLKLKSRLVEIGLTQAELAKFLGLSAPTVSQKINKLRPMNLEEAEKICEHLKIPEKDFSKYFFNAS